MIQIVLTAILLLSLPLWKGRTDSGDPEKPARAPIYPCLIHSTPAHFGAEKSQAIIGVQMASAYVGTCLMPPLFGLIAGRTTLGLLPGFLALFLIGMFWMHRSLIQKTAGLAQER